jgi:branched-subunit amino acid ABC-type transport system permease component
VGEAPTAAMLLGVHVTRVVQYVFVIASALAGISGLLIAMQGGIVNSEVGFKFKGFDWAIDSVRRHVAATKLL